MRLCAAACACAKPRFRSTSHGMLSLSQTWRSCRALPCTPPCYRLPRAAAPAPPREAAVAAAADLGDGVVESHRTVHLRQRISPHENLAVEFSGDFSPVRKSSPQKSTFLISPGPTGSASRGSAFEKLDCPFFPTTLGLYEPRTRARARAWVRASPRTSTMMVRKTTSMSPQSEATARHGASPGISCPSRRPHPRAGAKRSLLRVKAGALASKTRWLRAGRKEMPGLALVQLLPVLVDWEIGTIHDLRTAGATRSIGLLCRAQSPCCPRSQRPGSGR